MIEIDRTYTLSTWQKAPVMAGRAASQADVDNGRAIFCSAGAQALNMKLPAPAILRSPQLQPNEIAVIIVQAEKLANGLERYAAVAPNGYEFICSPTECTVVDQDDKNWRGKLP